MLVEVARSDIWLDPAAAAAVYRTSLLNFKKAISKALNFCFFLIAENYEDGSEASSKEERGEKNQHKNW